MQVNANVSREYTGISKARQDLKEAFMPIPILKMDAQYSSEITVFIILVC
jgi:hypothetical protein